MGTEILMGCGILRTFSVGPRRIKSITSNFYMLT